MGVYYYFYNVRTEQINGMPVPGFGECTHIAKLGSLDNIDKIFESVISVNPDWLPTDIIKAYPDYVEYSVIVYDKGTVTFEEPESS